MTSLRLAVARRAHLARRCALALVVPLSTVGPSFAASPAPGGALAALDRLAAFAADGAGYSVRIEAHEVLGDRSEDATFRYARDARGVQRLDVLEGSGAGTTLERAGATTVAFARRVPWLRRTLAPEDPAARSLRGNGIADADVRVLVACFDAHRAAVREFVGPRIDGQATTELVLDRRTFACPPEPAADRAITRDVVDVAQASGLPVLRKRYVGREVVERWALRDYQLAAVDGRSDASSR